MAEIIWSKSRLAVKTLMDSLTVTRRIEKTDPAELPYDFGNLKDANLARPPRLIWLNQGGIVLEMVQQAPPIVVPTTPPGPVEPITVPAVGYRRSNYLVRIWSPDVEKCEVILDQLVTASRLIANKDLYVFVNGHYVIPTETDGHWNELGSMIDATIGVRTSIAAEPIGAYQDVIVQGNEWRAGITQVEPMTIANIEDATTYEVDRLTGSPHWPG